MSKRDAQRIEEDIAGAERIMRPRTLASGYLHQSAEAMHAAGDPRHLYRQWRQRMPPMPFGRDFMQRWARDERFRQARTCILFAAFAAEAFVNEFLAAFELPESRLKEIDMRPTVWKYIDGTAEAYGERLFWAEDEVMPTLKKLFDLRNLLAHPKPGFGSPGFFEPDDPQFEARFAMSELAEYLVMVGGAADLLVWRAYGYGQVDPLATKLWRARTVVRDFARRRGHLPEPDEPDESSIWNQIGDYLDTQPPLGDHPDASWTRLREAEKRRRSEPEDGPV